MNFQINSKIFQKPLSSPDEARNRAMYQLINKEQQYVTALQFAVTRFVSALLERKDLITSHEHQVLFQNSEEVVNNLIKNHLSNKLNLSFRYFE